MTCLDYVSRRVGSVYRRVTALRHPEQAIEEANRHWTKRGINEVEVSEVRFCYFELGWNDVQTYLQPAYLILATLIGADRRVKMGGIFVAPAAVNAVRPIAPLPRAPRVQKPRSEPR